MSTAGTAGRRGRKNENARDLGVLQYMKQEASKQGIRGPHDSEEDMIPLGRLKRQIILQQLDKKMALQWMMWNRWFHERR